MVDENKLWERVYSNFYDRIVARYTELRQGPLAISNIDSTFIDFFDRISGFLYASELEKWKENPSPNNSSFSQIIGWIIQRIEQLDALYGVTIEEPTPLKVSFDIGDHVKVYVYRSQNTSLKSDLTNIAYARDSETGKLLSNGDGQCNFVVVFDEGFELDGDIQIVGNYKNLKTISSDDSSISYRITKITGDLTVTINAKSSSLE